MSRMLLNERVTLSIDLQKTGLVTYPPVKKALVTDSTYTINYNKRMLTL